MILLSVFVIVPVALWGILFLAFVGHGFLYRDAILAASTALAVFTVVLTECLSAIGGLTYVWVVLVWAMALILATYVLRERWGRGFVAVRQAPSPISDTWDRVVVGVLAFFVVGTFLAAFLYPIVNFDSLTYHMPRVLMWHQNQSVRFYPVPDGRHLFASTLVEYGILNLKILAGGTDRLASLVQWLSYCLAVSMGSLIALRLGASRRGQQISALAVAAAPMAVLEASTTQNDLTTAMWCMALAYLVLTYVKRPPRTIRAVAALGGWIGLVLALAFQSKASAYLVCAPFLIWLAITSLWRDGMKRSAILAGCLLLSTLALSAGIYARNASVFGANIIASDAPSMSHVLVRDRDPRTLATTALKNASMLVGSPLISANEAVVRAVGEIVSAYGGELENPATKEPTAPPYRLNANVPFAHDSAPSPLSFILLVLAFGVAAGTKENRNRYVVGFAVCSLAALLLLSSLVTWNEYVTRVLLPPLLLCLAVVGPATDAAPRHRGHITRLLVSCTVAAAVLWGLTALLFNWTNPLLPGSFLPVPEPSPIVLRDAGWWNTSYHDLGFRMNIPDKQYAYERIAQAVRENEVRRLAIAVPSGRPLYPLQAMLPEVRFQYVGDTLFPEKIPLGDFRPDAILEFSRIASTTPSADDSGLLLERQQVSAKSFIVLRRP